MNNTRVTHVAIIITNRDGNILVGQESTFLSNFTREFKRFNIEKFRNNLTPDKIDQIKNLFNNEEDFNNLLNGNTPNKLFSMAILKNLQEIVSGLDIDDACK